MVAVLSAVVIYVILLTIFTDNFTNEVKSEKPLVTIMLDGSFKDFNNFKKMIAAFEEENPDIRVKLNYTPVNYPNKLRLLVSANVPPDIGIIYDRNFREYLRWDVFTPLDSFINHPNPEYRGNMQEFRPLALKTFQHQGHQFCMPLYEGTLMVHYNRKLLKKANLPEPAPDWTWSDFLNIYCKNLTRDTDGDGRVDQFALNTLSSWLYWTPFMINRGADIISGDGNQWLMDTPEGWQTWDDFGELVWKYKAIPDYTNQVEKGWGNTGFILQRYAMTITGPWELALLTELPNLDFDVVMPPRDKNQMSRFISGGLCIFRQCKYKEAAWRLVKFITNTERGQAFSSRTRLPAMKSLKEKIIAGDYSFAEDPEVKAVFERTGKYMRKFIIEEDNLFFLNFNDRFEEMDRIINHNIEGLLTGGIDGKKFTKRVVNRFIEAGLFEEQYKGQTVDKTWFWD